ncbi:MAG: hypothetical protein KDI42_06690, partial [Gammaproteobacteria bacterium]|nr:hypothetical protein [Gammaproteobacteria bacterium]
HQPCMNDLHHVAVVGGHLYVANTGLGAVDVFTVSGEFMGSHSLLPAWANSKRMHGERAPEPLTRAHLAWSGTPPTSWPESADRGDGYFTSSREPQAFHQRKVPDHLHVNHVVSLDGRLLATCFADGSLRDLRTFEVAASVGRPFVHDGVVHGSSLWLTSVDGTVFELDRRTLGARRTLDACGSRHRGWCRGLAVTSEHLMVGLTESRRGGSLQQPWAQVETSGTETSVLLLDKAGGRLLARVEIKDRDRHTKLYSVLPTT